MPSLYQRFGRENTELSLNEVSELQRNRIPPMSPRKARSMRMAAISPEETAEADSSPVEAASTVKSIQNLMVY